MNFAFIERFAIQGSFAVVHELLMSHGFGCDLATGMFADEDETYIRNIKRSVATPLAGLTSRAANHFVVGFDYSIDGRNVFGSRCDAADGDMRRMLRERSLWIRCSLCCGEVPGSLREQQNAADGGDRDKIQRAERKQKHEDAHDLMVPDAASQVTAERRK